MKAGGSVIRLDENTFGVEAWTLEDDDGLQLRSDVRDFVELNRLDAFLATAGLRMLGPLPSEAGEAVEVGPSSST